MKTNDPPQGRRFFVTYTDDRQGLHIEDTFTGEVKVTDSDLSKVIIGWFMEHPRTDAILVDTYLMPLFARRRKHG